jgi:hypothetical protein
MASEANGTPNSTAPSSTALDTLKHGGTQKMMLMLAQESLTLLAACFMACGAHTTVQ